MAIVPQTTFATEPDRWLAGGRPFPSQDDLIISRMMEVAVNPGLFMARGTDTLRGAKPPALSADVTTLGTLLGVVLYKPTIEPASPNFAIGATVALVRRGIVACLCDGTVTDGGPLFICYDAGASSAVLGSVRADAGSGTYAAVAPKGCRVYEGAVGKGSICLVEINLPGA